MKKAFVLKNELCDHPHGTPSDRKEKKVCGVAAQERDRLATGSWGGESFKGSSDLIFFFHLQDDNLLGKDGRDQCLRLRVDKAVQVEGAE